MPIDICCIKPGTQFNIISCRIVQMLNLEHLELMVAIGSNIIKIFAGIFIALQQRSFTFVKFGTFSLIDSLLTTQLFNTGMDIALAIEHGIGLYKFSFKNILAYFTVIFIQIVKVDTRIAFYHILYKFLVVGMCRIELLQCTVAFSLKNLV